MSDFDNGFAVGYVLGKKSGGGGPCPPPETTTPFSSYEHFVNGGYKLEEPVANQSHENEYSYLVSTI